MFNTGNCPSVPIVANLDGNNGNNWNDGSWLWFLIVVFAIFGGWGNGFGGFGGTNGGVGSEIQRGFDNQAVISKLDGISNGLCDGFYAMNNSMLTGFNGINTNIMQTGYGIQQAVNADTVANMQNTNALQSQLANCCCETREAIQGVNYNMATNTCALQNTMNSNTRDIIDSQQAGTRAILDYLCNEKISSLQAENNDLRRAASQDRQSKTANLLYIELNKGDGIENSSAPIATPVKNNAWKGNEEYYLDNDDVRKWQHAMNIGFDTDELKEDGRFGVNSQRFAKNHNLWSGQRHNCPTAIKWLRKTLHDKYHFYKLDTDYGKWTDYLTKCVKVFQKNRGLKQDGYVGLITTYYLLKD